MAYGEEPLHTPILYSRELPHTAPSPLQPYIFSPL